VANAELAPGSLTLHCRLDDATEAFLHKAAARLGWSGRGLHRVLKVSRTIADLAHSETVTSGHVAEALQYRCGLRPS
jgi:magnesium chelatase family protein